MVGVELHKIHRKDGAIPLKHFDWFGKANGEQLVRRVFCHHLLPLARDSNRLHLLPVLARVEIERLIHKIVGENSGAIFEIIQ